GDDLGDLEAEAEALGGLVLPALDGLYRRRGVEGAVHLDNGIALGEVRQLLGGLQPLGVEDALPVLVGPAPGAGADEVHGKAPRGLSEAAQAGAGPDVMGSAVPSRELKERRPFGGLQVQLKPAAPACR